MSEIIFQEADFFAVSFLCGMILLAVYDILRIFRRTFSHGKEAVAAEDLIFWIISGVLVFGMMYEKNDGIIRGTAFLAIGLGMAAYHYSVSTCVVKLGYALLGRPIKKICLIFHRGLKKIQKAVKLLLEREGQYKKEDNYDASRKKSTKGSSKSN